MKENHLEKFHKVKKLPVNVTTHSNRSFYIKHSLLLSKNRSTFCDYTYGYLNQLPAIIRNTGFQKFTITFITTMQSNTLFYANSHCFWKNLEDLKEL